MNDWSPELYLKFRNERTQPSIDLVNRISIDWRPESILDVGCGPGNSSKVLLMRWPEAHLLGVDSSNNMIEKASKDYPESEWVVADAYEYISEKKVDIIFSNATLQWLPNHKSLLERHSFLLTNRGVLAFQIPSFMDMPLGKIIEQTGKRDTWKEKTAHCPQMFTFHNCVFYYSTMTGLFKSVELWETHYFHVLKSHQDIIDWVKSTGMKPYLDCLESERQRCEFTDEVLEQIVNAYPLQSDGNVLFPFKRLFVIGYEKKNGR